MPDTASFLEHSLEFGTTRLPTHRGESARESARAARWAAAKSPTPRGDFAMSAGSSSSTSVEDRVEDLDLQLKLFASYSPAEVVLRYANDPDPKPPMQPEHKTFRGAIGCVDVSGFTALSEKLNNDHGRKGAELLNQCAALVLQWDPQDPTQLAPSHCCASHVLIDT